MNALKALAQEKAAYPKIDAPCASFGVCGGCSLQDLTYHDQLAFKHERLTRALAPFDGLPATEIIGLEEPWRYRNKAEFTFGEVNGALVLGYHAAGSYWRVVDLDDCLLLPEPATRLLRDVRELCAQSGLRAYHPTTHQGFFRFLLVRCSRVTGHVLACLVTSPETGSDRRPARGTMEHLADALTARHPTLTSVYWGLSGKLADVAVPDQLMLLRGSAYLDDALGPFRLQLHPLSFLQPSSIQAERLYTRLCQAVSRVASGIAWDLYCGVGLAGFYLAGHVRKVYGIDVETHHLDLARTNAALNGLENVEFRVGRVETLLMDRRFWLQEARPDVIVVDPPRIGLHPQAISSVLAARPVVIGYISCNVQSLIRDLAILRSGFPRYRVRELQAFDMFPQTNHVELLAVLERA